jgi:large subunit ribosomal protein L25
MEEKEMYVLHAEKRKPNFSAKQIKKQGLIPGNVYGKNLDGSLLIQLNQNDVRRLLKSKTAGNKLTLSVDGQEYFVLMKEIGRSSTGDKIENLSFQVLNKDEKVVSSARVKLLNKEKIGRAHV